MSTSPIRMSYRLTSLDVLILPVMEIHCHALSEEVDGRLIKQGGALQLERDIRPCKDLTSLDLDVLDEGVAST